MRHTLAPLEADLFLLLNIYPHEYTSYNRTGDLSSNNLQLRYFLQGYYRPNILTRLIHLHHTKHIHTPDLLYIDFHPRTPTPLFRQPSSTDTGSPPSCCSLPSKVGSLPFPRRQSDRPTLDKKSNTSRSIKQATPGRHHTHSRPPRPGHDTP